MVEKPDDILYRKDEDRYRVWRREWSHDQFEVLNANEFDAMMTLADRINMTVIEADD